MTITVGELKALMGYQATDVSDDARLDLAVNAALAYIAEVRPERDWRNPTDSERLGLLRLAERLFERNGATEDGMNAEYGFGGPIPLINNELASLLGLGRHHAPVIS